MAIHANVSSTLGGVSMMTISSLGATNSFSSLRCRYLQWGLSQHYYSKSNHHSTGKIYYFGEDVIRYKPQIIRKSQKLLKSAKLILMKKFTIFLVKSKLSTTKQCKTTTFSRFFLVKSKLSKVRIVKMFAELSDT